MFFDGFTQTSYVVTIPYQYKVKINSDILTHRYNLKTYHIFHTHQFCFGYFEISRFERTCMQHAHIKSHLSIYYDDITYFDCMHNYILVQVYHDR